MTSLTTAGATAELAISQGRASNTSVPKDAFLNVVLGGAQPFPAGSVWQVSCAWLGGAGADKYLVAT